MVGGSATPRGKRVFAMSPCGAVAPLETFSHGSISWIPVRAGKFQSAVVADIGPRHVTGLLHPDLCIANPDPIVDGLAQISLAQHLSGYAVFANEIDFGWSRGEQSGTVREKSGWRCNAIGPRVSDAGDLHAGLREPGMQKTREANELEHEAVSGEP